MVKHLIVIHGRSIKPAQAEMEKLVEAAIINGLNRAELSDVATRIKSGDIKFSFAYYGDINNNIQAKKDRKDSEILTANDPDHGNARSLPHTLLADAMALTLQTSKKFTRAAYKSVLAEAKDSRFADEMASVVSFFGELATFGYLNEKVIEFAKPDMMEYLLSHKTGSAVRQRLQDILVPAIKANDDIMLISHSMGCMVAYDVFWKISHESEYRDTRAADNPIQNWVTIGCPLGEPGVRKNLRDGHRRDDDRFPRNEFLHWHNFHAEDDFIAHKSSMKRAFGKMVKYGHTASITDRKIYNCWVYNDVATGNLISNPHDFYGYLMHEKISTQISDWAN